MTGQELLNALTDQVIASPHSEARTLIAIPCMDMIPVGFAQSLLNLRKSKDTYYAFHANSMIYDSRNNFAANAIEKEFDRVLWIDSDMMFQPDLLERLGADMDEYGTGLVSALAFKRKLPTTPCIYKELSWGPGDDGVICAKAETYLDYPQDAVFPVKGAGFGAVLTTTELLQEVWDKYGPPFDPLTKMGEDLSFCFRAGKLGRILYCDSRVKVGHIGQYVFTEADYIRPAKETGNGPAQRV